MSVFDGPAAVEGAIDPRFSELENELQERLDSGEELGFALTVDLDGQRVVDAWGGHRDPGRTRPWTSDTLVNVWSLTKTVSALAVLLLVDRGEIDVFAPVARYWPEFAVGGKERIEVRHLLSHTSGLFGFAGPVTVEDLYDVRSAAARLAAQSPWWEPGTASGYHLLSYGHLVSELVFRVTGCSLREFVAEELAGPLTADFRIGAGPEDDHRVAPLVPPRGFDATQLPHDGVPYRTLTGPQLDAATANTIAWRRAEIGAANGHGTARSLADLMSLISQPGGADARPRLRDETIALIFEEQSRGVDLANGLDLRWGIGFALPSPATSAWLPDGRIALRGGWGGSLLILDLERRLTISYVMNRRGDTDPVSPLRIPCRPPTSRAGRAG